MSNNENATKRLAVTDSTWRALHQMRKPGQTYDELIKELMDIYIHGREE